MLACLADACATFKELSADCERGLSLMNTIKTKSRNRLEAERLDMLMRINCIKTLDAFGSGSSALVCAQGCVSKT